MRFSWAALFLAPPVVPCVFAILIAMTPFVNDPLLGFLVLFAIGCLISYGVTVCLFIPALFVLSLVVRPRLHLVAVLGAFLGALAYLPLSYISYKSSGPDSGPPEGAFLDFLLRDLSDPIAWTFPIAGLLTATLYWLLASHRIPPFPPRHPLFSRDRLRW